MEVRFWLPKTWGGWRYCLKHPRYFVIGAYGFDRWVVTHRKLVSAVWRIFMLETKLQIMREELAAKGKEISRLKRGERNSG